MPAEGGWTRAVGALALGKVAVALLLFLASGLAGRAETNATVPWVSLAVVLAYGIAGATLLIGGRLDARCRELGVYFLLIASPFADLLAKAGGEGPLATVVSGLRVDAFMPVFLWMFVRDFPVRSTPGWSFTVPTLAARVSLAFALLLVAANLLHDMQLVDGWPLLAASTAQLSRTAGPPYLYWQVLFILSLPATPVLLARSRYVGPGNRRRVFVFLILMLAGLVPLSADVVLRATSTRWSALVTDSVFGQGVVTFVLAALLSAPFTTAYAVVVAHVADLRVVVRTGVQYALARYSVLSLVFLPVVVLGWWIYTNRTVTVESLLFGKWTGILLVSVLAAAVSLAAVRTRLLTAIDRRFFREQFDAHRILTSLVDAARRAGSSDEFVDLLSSEADRALHPERIAVLIHDERQGLLRARHGHLPDLSAGSVLIQLLAKSDEPLEIDPHDTRSVFARLDDAERSWLADGGFRLLVPFRGSEGGLGGLLALGEKKSELPYSSEDRKLLAAVGASGGLYFERRRGFTPTPPRPLGSSPETVSRAAVECTVCGLVVDGRPDSCECGGPLREARVPKILAQKFRIERRIGAGGMGVVYRADDLGLGRVVAIKTLPHAGSSDKWRLRREARAMALVSHENLAMIYGLESWTGTPLLIEEYLAGGTLADRLAAGPRPLAEVIEMGLVVGGVLQTIHGVGLLHRDIKPSNIGFSAGGTIKLLDFGLAQMMTAALPDATPSADVDSMTRSVDLLAGITDRGLGTPSYMSPEAIRSEDPAISFDLWSLTVVLYEALSGANPFKAATLLETMNRIDQANAEALAASLPSGRSDIALFFTAALAADRRRRPASAADFTKRLAALSVTQ